MDAAALGTLLVLALADSTSLGTLLIPVWLLMTPGRVRVGRALSFLFTVASIYFLLGLALLAGASALFVVLDGSRAAGALLLGQLVIGAGMIVISYLMDTERARARAASGRGRLGRWRSRAMGEGPASSLAALLALAVVAVLAELATMLPYLTAIGVIAAGEAGAPGRAVLLAGYCLVMILPALVLTAGRLLARSALEAPLARLERLLTRHAHSALAWIIGIVGVLLCLRAVQELGWPELLLRIGG